MFSKKFLPAFAFGAVLLFFSTSCNNSEDQSGKQDTGIVKPADSNAVATPAKPGNILVVMHKVKDFDKWLPVFEADDSVQRANGLTRSVVAKGIDDPSMVLIGFRMADYDKAKAMGSSQALKDKMKSAGVISEPKMYFENMQVMDTSTNSMTDRIIIFAKVKDYDAWKKSFDDHNDVRKNGGVTDRGVGYSFTDKNEVTVVLAINDMKKARDFIKSPELKARMDSSGVISKPDIFFYHITKQY